MLQTPPGLSEMHSFANKQKLPIYTNRLNVYTHACPGVCTRVYVTHTHTHKLAVMSTTFNLFEEVWSPEYPKGFLSLQGLPNATDPIAQTSRTGP